MIPKLEICLVTQCVSGRRDRRYLNDFNGKLLKITHLCSKVTQITCGIIQIKY
jgi:hypothetical protein